MTDPDSPNQHIHAQELLSSIVRGAHKVRQENASASFVGCVLSARAPRGPSGCRAQTHVWQRETTEQAGGRRMIFLSLLEEVSLRKKMGAGPPSS